MPRHSQRLHGLLSNLDVFSLNGVSTKDIQRRCIIEYLARGLSFLSNHVCLSRLDAALVQRSILDMRRNTAKISRFWPIIVEQSLPQPQASMEMVLGCPPRTFRAGLPHSRQSCNVTFFRLLRIGHGKRTQSRSMSIIQ